MQGTRAVDPGRPTSGVVTLSASYGAGGSIIGPAVARRLGLAFYDRAVPAAAASRLAVAVDEAEANDERPPGLRERLVAALAGLVVPTGPDLPGTYVDVRRSFTEATEDVVRAIADGRGGVILGRAAAVVLASRPGVLRVRIDGPVEARVAQATRLFGLDEATARARLRETDRAREGYLQSFYGRSQSDASLYEIVLDSASLGVELCVDVIVLAAREVLAR